MASNSVNTGASGRIEVNLVEGTLDPANNRSYIYWTAYLYERVSSPQTYGTAPGSSVALVGAGTVWAGEFSFDWRPAGLQTTLVASGEGWHGRNPDGSGSASLGFSMGDTGTAGAGGPAYVGLTVPLAKLTTLPGVPTGVSAVRVSDTQVSLSWAQTSASNGAPVSNLIQRRVNNGVWEDLVTVSATTSATVAASPNQKLEYRVAGRNAAGTTAWSASSSPIFTTPGKPSGASAFKNTSNDVVVGFTPNVAYSEHTHEVWHGVVSGGSTTWDSSALATLPSGVVSYTHSSPNSAQVHVYRVRAVAGSLVSGWAETGSVQLQAPPNKPSLPSMNPFADRAVAFTYSWQHNPVDTTAQTAYEVSTSTNGGSTWSTTGKVSSTAQQRVFPANSYLANTALTIRVRTWGAASTGGSDGTGASPWSDLRTVTFKTAPTVTIVSPSDGSSISASSAQVGLAFSQAQGATFVKAELLLLKGMILQDSVETTSLAGIPIGHGLDDGVTYTVRARVQDSNGLFSAWQSVSFTVDYLQPVPAVVSATYLPDRGFTQLDLQVPDPVENLFTNPSFEAGSGTVEVRRNLFTNPSFEAAGGEVEVWRSALRNPLGRQGSAWTTSGTDTVTQEVAVSGWPTPVAAQASATTTGVFARTYAHGLPGSLTPGQIYYARAVAESDTAGFMYINLIVRDESGGIVREVHYTSEGRAVAAGERFDVTVPFTPEPGEVRADVGIRLGSGSAPVATGTRVTITAVAALGLSSRAPLFDGEFSEDDDYTPSWSGAPRNSAAVLTGREVSSSYNGVSVRSTKWKSTGDYSLRLFANQSGTTFSYLGAIDQRPVLEPGETYTLQAKVYIPEPLDAPGNAVDIRFTHQVGGAPIGPNGAVPNEAGVHTVTVVATMPDPLPDYAVNVRLYNRSNTLGESVWVDDLMIVKGVYDGPWFSGGQDVAETVTITRTIDGVPEVIVEDYPVESVLSFLDTTPTIHGTNTYTITTKSALNAESTVTVDVVTTECRRAFLGRGPGYGTVGVFGGNLSVDEKLSVANSVIETAGRVRPIGLYGVESSVQVKVSSLIFEKEGYSTVDELRDILLMTGKSCYRDASGRRVFGTVSGGVKYNKTTRGTLNFTLTETD